MLHLFALKVLLLAGGGEAADNHESHLQHIQAAQALLAARGVEDVAVFWADGDARGPDRATGRHKLHADDWLLQGARLDPLSDPGPILKDTRLKGARPAKREALQAYLKELGAEMSAEDTLLIAVTDHGEPDPAGGEDTAITLWGERWTTSQLEADLAPIPSEARVVLWMSQCFSGGFANIKRPNTCGAFSAVSDRPAFGCIPAWSTREDVGHFLRMLEAFEEGASTLQEAADATLVDDDTPDTPHLTSDALLYRALAERAHAEGLPIARLIDAALPSRPATDPDWRRLARLTSRYGLGAPQSYQEVEATLDELSGGAEALEAWHRTWSEGLRQALDLLGAGYYPLKKGPRGQRKRLDLRRRLIKRLRRRLSKQRGLRPRLERMRAKIQRLDALYDRLSLQEGAAIRAAYLLARLAAPSLIDEATRARIAAVQRCERALLLPPPSKEVAAPEPEEVTAPPPPKALPRFHRLWGEIEAARPGYFGVQFRDLPGFKGVEVTGLTPGGPAMASALQVGDRILSVDGWRLRRQGGFMESTLLAAPGATSILLVKRGAKRLEIPLRVAPRQRPKVGLGVGDVVGPLWLKGERGPLPVIGGRPVILLFWATWCDPCQEALPDLKALAQRRGARIIAVSDEAPQRVRGFLRRFKGFDEPEGLISVARDPAGEAKAAFGVESFPTFIALDADGRVLEIGEGFKEGLPLSSRD